MYNSTHYAGPIVAPAIADHVMAGSSDFTDYRRYFAEYADTGQSMPVIHDNDPPVLHDQEQDDPVTRFILDRLLLAAEFTD